jgi:hypothetical protein
MLVDVPAHDWYREKGHPSYRLAYVVQVSHFLADWKGIPMAQTIFTGEKILTGEQVGHLRHFNNLSRLPINDWSLMSRVRGIGHTPTRNRPAFLRPDTVSRRRPDAGGRHRPHRRCGDWTGRWPAPAC